MKKPVLAVMAAGMGSRYGGLKQIDPVDENGHVILDYSVYDAIEAGFEKVVFIIKKENEGAFRKLAKNHFAGKIEVDFAFQSIDDIPEKYDVPIGRIKPWGTAHAVRSLRGIIKDEPFAAINADDYYGKEAFSLIYDRMVKCEMLPDADRYAFVAYELGKTVTENGYVARGVCSIDENDILKEVVERTRIEKHINSIEYTEDDGKSWVGLPFETPVSMNVWGFPPSFIDEINNRFETFLETGLKNNPMKCEFYLPFVVEQLISEGKAKVRVLYTHDKWYGVTYKEDKKSVVEALAKLRKQGLYDGM